MSYVLGTTLSDTLNGTADADMIDGLGAADTLHGQDGADTIWGGDGNDALFGDLGSDTLYGQAGADALDGGDGNDILDGGAGNDTMTGGLGDDVYYVTSGDTLIETAGGGYDVVYTNGNFDLTRTPYIEAVQITSSTGATVWGNFSDNLIIGSVGNDGLLGGEGDDRLYGGDGDDILQGNEGNDYLDGGAGPGRLDGGDGDDTYVINNDGQLVNELNGNGLDTVLSAVSFMLPNLVERLVLTNAGALEGAGNSLANTILGGAGDNRLYGADGADTIEGGLGADDLSGGDRNGLADGVADRFVYTSAMDSTLTSTDIIHGFEMGRDKIDLTGVRTGASDQFLLGVTANGTDVLQVDLGGDGSIDMMIVATSSNGVTHLTSADIEWAPILPPTVGYVWGAPGDDLLIGTGAPDIIRGLAGADQLQGQNGNDTLYGGDGDDRLFGEGGLNTLYGEAGSDALYGGDANDILDGGTGADWMQGALGADSYFVDDVGDNVVEALNGGYDSVKASVSWTMTANVEVLELVGTNLNGAGNAIDNIIIGTAGVNALSGFDGDDRLYGGAGADWLYGGDGNDLLDGGADGDFLFGGAGDDTYVVDRQAEWMVEDANAGIDTVRSSATNALNANFENLILTGSANIDGGGNDLDNVIIGNDGVNSLIGGAGADIIIGGLGADVLYGASQSGLGDGVTDRFVYTSAQDSSFTVSDSIFRFEVGLDKIDLTGVRTGASDALFLGVTPNGTDVVEVDLGGDGTIDMKIAVAAISGHLTTGDILW